MAFFCHESGCPNQKKTWIPDLQDWRLFVDCRECGSPIEEGEVCSCVDDQFADDEIAARGEDYNA